MTTHAYTGPLWLLGVVGPFGYGAGTKTQGAQHLSASIDTPLVEGGLETGLVELGIEYHLINTRQPYDQALSAYLNRRARTRR